MSYLPHFVVTILLFVIGFLILRKIYNYIFVAYHILPLRKWGFTNMPAIPFSIEKALTYLVRLAERGIASAPVKRSLANKATIKGINSSGYEFLYGDNSDLISQEKVDSLARTLKNTAVKMTLSKNIGLASIVNMHIHNERDDQNRLQREDLTLQDLFFEDPSQFDITIPHFDGIYKENMENISLWGKSFTNVNTANKHFWDFLHKYTIIFNSQLLSKVLPKDMQTLKQTYGAEWTDDMTGYCNDGLLYCIDLTIFTNFESSVVNNHPRFTPGTFTLLYQDKDSKDLTPFAIWASDYQNKNSEFYKFGSCPNSTWLYALLAAKVSISAYHVWIGHVYTLHIATAPLQMTLFQNIPTTHSLYELLGPISNHLIEFNNIMFFAWDEVAPPTSASSFHKFLQIQDTFAKDRNFFDDDPIQSLEARNIYKEDFSASEDWDMYIVAKQQIELWNIAKEYVNVFVNTTYSSDEDVSKDKPLQKWIKEASKPKIGNVQGLPKMTSKEALSKVLTSLIYRVTTHGTSRLPKPTIPIVSYPTNTIFCLQRTDLPPADKDINTKELLSYLPNTGTFGEGLNFYFFFLYSPPIENLVPFGGIKEELFFNNEDPKDPRNKALIEFRRSILEFENNYFPESLMYQWERSIET